MPMESERNRDELERIMAANQREDLAERCRIINQRTELDPTKEMPGQETEPTADCDAPKQYEANPQFVNVDRVVAVLSDKFGWGETNRRQARSFLQGIAVTRLYGESPLKRLAEIRHNGPADRRLEEDKKDWALFDPASNKVVPGELHLLRLSTASDIVLSHVEGDVRTAAENFLIREFGDNPNECR